MAVWFRRDQIQIAKKKKGTPEIRIYKKGYITLNVEACNYLKIPTKVLIGFDDNYEKLLIKPIRDNEDDKDSFNVIPLTKNANYGRINNVGLTRLLLEDYELPPRVTCTWNEEERQLECKIK